MADLGEPANGRLPHGTCGAEREGAQPSHLQAERMSAIAVTSITGTRYRLAHDGMVDWWAGSDAGLTYVLMSRAAKPDQQPVLVCATVKEIDACYAQLAQCAAAPKLENKPRN